MRYRHILCAAASAAGLLTTAGAAYAQATSDDASVEELVVTGTRTEGRSRLESLAPVDVISEQALQRQGTTELGAALATPRPVHRLPAARDHRRHRLGPPGHAARPRAGPRRWSC